MDLVYQLIGWCPKSIRAEHAGKRKVYQAKPINRNMGAGLDLVLQRRDKKLTAIDIDACFLLSLMVSIKPCVAY